MKKPVDYLPVAQRTADTQYKDYLRHIMKHGKKKFMPSHNENVLMIVGHQMRFDMTNGFPLQTERDLSGSMFTGAIGEHLGFLNGAQTHEQLKEFGCPWWKNWVTKENCERFGIEEGNLGDGSYGAAWTRFPSQNGKTFNQIKNVVAQIKNKPYLRTHFISPWIPPFIISGDKDFPRKVVVAPCHGWIHIHVFPETKELSIMHTQRSADAPVGLVFNIPQYASFGMMLAQETGYEMTELVYGISDGHIYESQFNYVEELISRESRKFPTVTIDPSIKSIFDFRTNHFKLEDYNPHEKMFIPTPV